MKKCFVLTAIGCSLILVSIVEIKAASVVQEVNVSNGSEDVPSVSFDTNGNLIITSSQTKKRVNGEQPTVVVEDVDITQTSLTENVDNSVDVNINERPDRPSWYKDEGDSKLHALVDEDERYHDPEGDTYSLCRSGTGAIVLCDSIDCADGYCVDLNREEEIRKEEEAQEEEDALKNHGYYSGYYASID